MTKQETEQLLRYMICMYPNARMNEQQFNSILQLWFSEFQNASCDLVGSAFRLARSESPDWMPSIPKIQQAMRTIESRLKPKSEEQEFMDSHCGKTKKEWDSLEEWEKSQDGAKRVQNYKQILLKLVGG